MKVYLIGALKNPQVPLLAKEIEALGMEAFADWFAPGPEADQFLWNYGKSRGWNYKQILKSAAAQHEFEFDKHHLDTCDAAVMVMPCGKSGHNEAGYLEGRGIPVFILFDGEPDRLDLMPPNFATDFFFDRESLLEALKKVQPRLHLPDYNDWSGGSTSYPVFKEQTPYDPKAFDKLK